MRLILNLKLLPNSILYSSVYSQDVPENTSFEHATFVKTTSPGCPPFSLVNLYGKRNYELYKFSEE